MKKFLFCFIVAFAPRNVMIQDHLPSKKRALQLSVFSFMLQSASTAYCFCKPAVPLGNWTPQKSLLCKDLGPAKSRSGLDCESSSQGALKNLDYYGNCMYENPCDPFDPQCLLCTIEELMGKTYVEDVCKEYDGNLLTCSLTSVESSLKYEKMYKAHYRLLQEHKHWENLELGAGIAGTLLLGGAIIQRRHRRRAIPELQAPLIRSPGDPIIDPNAQTVEDYEYYLTEQRTFTPRAEVQSILLAIEEEKDSISESKGTTPERVPTPFSTTSEDVFHPDHFTNIEYSFQRRSSASATNDVHSKSLNA